MRENNWKLEVARVFGEEYLTTAHVEFEVSDKLQCDPLDFLPCIRTKWGVPCINYVYYDGAIWKAVVWTDLSSQRMLITAASLHSLKVKMDLL